MTVSQKVYINKFKHIIHSPLYYCNQYFNDKIKKYVPGKRHYYSNQEHIDYRTVGVNEIVFELDAKVFKKNVKFTHKILEVLDIYNIPVEKRFIYDSGGKGLHIEIFFNKVKFKSLEEQNIFEKAVPLGLSYKDIRLWFWGLICREAGISDKLCGIGKVVDSSCITFNEHDERFKIIRNCGGRKTIINNDTGEFETFFKTWVTESELDKKRKKVSAPLDVNYPKELQCFDLPYQPFIDFLHSYIDIKTKTCKYDKPIDFGSRTNNAKSYFNLPCIKKLLDGIEEGNRSVGSQILSIALSLDRYELSEAEQILKQYVNNCKNGIEMFNFEEAKSWLNWTFGQPDIFWNCALAQRIGLCDKTNCHYHKTKNSESFELLNNPKILEIIKDELDKVIVGEDATKLLIFLLALTKYLKADDEFNIPGDPQPQAVIIMGASSLGKTFVVKNILPLYNDEDKIEISRATKNALDGLGRSNDGDGADLSGKILFLEELQGLDESTNQLRLLISEGKLNLLSNEKDEQGKIKSEFIKTKGKVMFITCTAQDTVQQELSTRVWEVSLDGSRIQTEKILKLQDDQTQMYVPDRYKIDSQQIKKSLQSLDNDVHFMIPYYDYKLLNIPTSNIRVRRDYAKLKSIICASAFLHQQQRTIVTYPNGKKFIIANFDDYKNVLWICKDAISGIFQGMSATHIDALSIIGIEVRPGDNFTVNDVKKWLDCNRNKAYTICLKLSELGFINIESSHGPSGSNIYTLSDKKIHNYRFPMIDEIKDTFDFDKWLKVLNKNLDNKITEVKGYDRKKDDR